MHSASLRLIWWCIGGTVLGLAFPMAACVWATEGNLDLASIRAAHRSQPVLTIIDTAPIVLGIAGAIAGVLHQRVHAAYERCELTVQERTAELQSVNNHLVNLMNAKDQFVGTVGHELRTPITAVTGFAQLLRDSHRDSSAEEVAELVDVISTQAADVADILEDLLVASRGEISALSIDNHHLDLREKLVECLRTLCPKRDRAGLRQSADLHPAPVFADPGRVRQIIRNLLTNADRYGGSGRCVQTGIDGSEAYVRVCDDGTGIPAPDVERIFEAYTQSTRTMPASGSIGIGLSVSRTLARLMHGDLTYCRADGWTVFELRLPLEDADCLAGMAAT